MSDEAENSKPTAKKKVVGRPFEKGRSGNPGGAPKQVAEVRELARQHTVTAINELIRLAMEGKHEKTRLDAIIHLLDRGYGKPTQAMTIDADVRTQVTQKLEELTDTELSKIAKKK